MNKRTDWQNYKKVIFTKNVTANTKKYISKGHFSIFMVDKIQIELVTAAKGANSEEIARVVMARYGRTINSKAARASSVMNA